MMFQILVIISLSLTLLGKYWPNDKLVWIFKPLTTGLIIIAGLSMTDGLTPYSWLILAGLLFCLIGDIALIPKSKIWFLTGLGLFLIGHILFLFAFFQVANLIFDPRISVFVFFCLGFFFLMVHKYVSTKMKVPVLLYALTVAGMVYGAGLLWIQQNPNGLMIVIGAILFMISDFTLAFNRFRQTFVLAEILILPTYYLGIYLIALSI